MLAERPTINLSERAGVTKVYARATRQVLEQAGEKLTEPWGQVIEFERRAG